MPPARPMSLVAMKRAILMLGLLLALSGAVAGTASASDAAPATVERLPGLDAQILARLNATRAAHGLRPLVVSAELENAAVAHSRDLIQAGVFQHDSPDGTSFVQRLKRFYTPSGYSSWTAGENLLYNTAEIDADTAIQAWLESPPHRENMLDPDWREVGIGSVHASTAGGTFGGAPTWVITMDFGARTGGAKTAAKAPVSVKAVAAKKKATAKKRAKKRAAANAKKPAAKAKPKQKPKPTAPPAPDPSAGAPYEPPVAGSPDPQNTAALGHRPDGGEDEDEDVVPGGEDVVPVPPPTEPTPPAPEP